MCCVKVVVTLPVDFFFVPADLPASMWEPWGTIVAGSFQSRAGWFNQIPPVRLSATSCYPDVWPSCIWQRNAWWPYQQGSETGLEKELTIQSIYANVRKDEQDNK